MNADLQCQAFVELVTDYLEGALASAEDAAVDAHLVGCEGCATYLEQMQEVRRFASFLREESVRPVQLETLRAAFRSRRQAPAEGSASS